jgi:pectin methylesterase-like acyl-CoA thioesterase
VKCCQSFVKPVTVAFIARLTVQKPTGFQTKRKENKRMKKMIGIGVCLFSLVGAAMAQSDAVISFKLPSAAMLGAATLPAGNYTVTESDNTGGSSVLVFRGPDGTTRNVLATETEINPVTADHSAVLLKSDGERLHVTEVMIEGRGYAFRVAE